MNLVIDFFIITATTTTIALIWRSLLMGHPVFLRQVEKLPIIGGALTCGFCFTVWLSLIAVLLYDPIAFWHPELPFYFKIFVSWFTLAAIVLFFRNLIAVLMEGNGVLSDIHQKMHHDNR